MNAVEDFGATPDDFDIDSWIDQATRPRREVTIYRDWSLLTEYDRLIALRESGGDDESMGDESVDAQIADVIERMEASKVVFTVEARTQDEVRAVVESLGGEPGAKVDPVPLGDALVADAIISHDVTAEQMRRMREKLGDGPLHKLYAAVADLRTAGQVLPEVPSSREH